MEALALTYDHLEVSYGAIRALRGIDLAIPAGSSFAVLGPNGAGKSTLAEATAGLLAASGGRILLDGDEITGARTADRVARGISLVAEGRQLFPRLTVEENLELGSHARQRGTMLEQVYELFPVLGNRRHQVAGTMSGGEQQMLAIGRSLMSEPRVLILDEPSSGLAPAIIEVLFEQLRTIAGRSTTVVLIEQNVRAALSVATHAAVLNAGRLVATGTPDELGGDETLAALYFGAT